MPPADPFKTCSCGTIWPTREAFLHDPQLSLIGYMPSFADLKLGILLFNHDKCRTTIATRVDAFADLYDGPVYADRKTGTAECPGHCLRKSDLDPCPAQCECAWVREVIQRVAREHVAAPPS